MSVGTITVRRQSPSVKRGDHRSWQSDAAAERELYVLPAGHHRAAGTTSSARPPSPRRVRSPSWSRRSTRAAAPAWRTAASAVGPRISVCPSSTKTGTPGTVASRCKTWRDRRRGKRRLPSRDWPEPGRGLARHRGELGDVLSASESGPVAGTIGAATVTSNGGQPIVAIVNQVNYNATAMARWLRGDQLLIRGPPRPRVFGGRLGCRRRGSRFVRVASLAELPARGAPRRRRRGRGYPAGERRRRNPRVERLVHPFRNISRWGASTKRPTIPAGPTSGASTSPPAAALAANGKGRPRVQATDLPRPR